MSELIDRFIGVKVEEGYCWAFDDNYGVGLVISCELLAN